PGVRGLCAQQGARVRGDRRALRGAPVRRRRHRARAARSHRSTERRPGRARHPRAASAAGPDQCPARARSGRAGKGYRRFPLRKPRRPRRRAVEARALHARRRDAAHRARSCDACRPPRRGDRPLQHRRQAARPAPLAEGRHRHHLPFEDHGAAEAHPRSRRPRCRRRAAETRHRRDGQTGRVRHRRGHQPPPRRDAGRRRRFRRRQERGGLDYAGAGGRRPDDDCAPARELRARCCQMNPLLDFSALPRFQDLKPEHVAPAVDQLLAEGRATTAAVIHASPSWDAFVAPLEDANERVARAWGQVSHLHAVVDSPALRAVYNANLPKISQYWTELGQNQALFEKYKALRDSPEFVQLSKARRKVVDNALPYFRLGGAERATLLGYRSYAEVSLVPKMAESPEQVLRFLDDLARRARPFAERDVEELGEFARNELHIRDLQAWDVAYASEKLRAKRYAFSDQEVKQYFPEDAAVAGLFRVAETLYGIRILPSRAPAWHKDVRFFEIRDSAVAASNPVIGQFYTDLYARDTKRGGAWMDDAITRRRKGAQLQT